MKVSLKRVYEPPASSDGKRILVERLWPRGMTRQAAHVDLWLKDVAPSPALRKWYGHEMAKWDAFQAKYRAELESNPALEELRRLARQGHVTLVYASKDERHNSALVLKQVLDGTA
ncbi:DUF488 domain-containing protein [[Pseudomonas] boreopolis]|uniref:DUF488 domain-containing protein n=1 Tax=Xanthomonas boreopolis TaxID=86183 RepID=UPI003D9B2BD2